MKWFYNLKFNRLFAWITACLLLCFSCFGLFDFSTKDEQIQASAEEVETVAEDSSFLQEPFYTYTIVFPKGSVFSNVVWYENLNEYEYTGCVFIISSASMTSFSDYGFYAANGFNAYDYFSFNGNSFVLLQDFYLPVLIDNDYFGDYFPITQESNWTSVYCGSARDNYVVDCNLFESVRLPYNFYLLRSVYTEEVNGNLGDYMSGYYDGYAGGLYEGNLQGYDKGYTAANFVNSIGLSSCYVDITNEKTGYLVGSYPLNKVSSLGEDCWKYYFSFDDIELDDNTLYRVSLRFSPYLDGRIDKIALSAPFWNYEWYFDKYFIDLVGEDLSVLKNQSYQYYLNSSNDYYYFYPLQSAISNGYYRISSISCLAYGDDFKEIKQINVSTYSLMNFYNQGYSDGNTNGYNRGFEQGEFAGKTAGYTQGLSEGLKNAELGSFLNLATSVIDAPIKSFLGLVDFEILGMNMRVFFLSLLTGALVIAAFRLFSGGKA